MIGVGAAQAAGNRIAGELPVRVCLVPAPDALGLARVTALFEEGLVLGPFLLAHGASCFPGLLDAHEAIHNPTVETPVQQNAVHAALMLYLFLARAPVQIVFAVTGGAHGTEPLALYRLDFVEPRIKRVQVAAVEVEDVQRVALLVGNQRAICNTAKHALVPVALLRELRRAVFVHPARIALFVRFDADTHTHERPPPLLGGKYFASQSEQSPLPSPSRSEEHTSELQSR